MQTIPSTRAAPGLASPLLETAQRMVMSTASCAPWYSGSPEDTTSTHRSSSPPHCDIHVSEIGRSHEQLPPVSLQDPGQCLLGCNCPRAKSSWGAGGQAAPVSSSAVRERPRNRTVPPSRGKGNLSLSKTMVRNTSGATVNSGLVGTPVEHVRASAA